MKTDQWIQSVTISALLKMNHLGTQQRWSGMNDTRRLQLIVKWDQNQPEQVNFDVVTVSHIYLLL